jgi:hypothetical protein
MRVGAEAQLSFVTVPNISSNRQRLAMRLGLGHRHPLRQIATWLRSRPTSLRIILSHSLWHSPVIREIRCEVDEDGFYLASTQAVFPDLLLPVVMPGGRDGRLSYSIGVRLLASQGRSLFIIRQAGDSVFFGVGDQQSAQIRHAPHIAGRRSHVASSGRRMRSRP